MSICDPVNDEPLLSGQPLFSGHLPASRGWLLNGGSPLFKAYAQSTATDVDRLRDIHNWIKHERIIRSVHVHA